MDDILAALTDGATVVTANRRLARSISLAFNRRQRSAGRLAWRTPPVLPWQEWLGQLWSQSPGRAWDHDNPAVLTDFQARILWRDIVRDLEGAEVPEAALPVADLAARAWKLCRDWQIAPGDLAAEADSDDTRTFAAWAGTFESRCASGGWTDAGSLPGLVATAVRRNAITPPRRIHLAGFADWTPVQREFLRVLATTGSVVQEEPAPRAQRRAIGRIACHDKRQELNQAARWARQRIHAEPLAVVGIVVPDLQARVAEVRRGCLDVFAPGWRLAPGRELPVNFSWGESLAGNGLVHAAMLALRLLAGSLDYRDAGQLLRTPYIAGSPAEAGSRARVDLLLRRQIGTQVGIVGLSGQLRPAAPVLAARIEALAAIAGTMPRRQRTGGWVETFEAALQAVGWPGDRPLPSDGYQTAMAWQERLDEFRACDRIAGSMTLHSALTLLDGILREPYQPAGNPEGVQVTGLLEAIGQPFDALWICNLTSDTLPPATRPNPLLPLALQRRLGMPDSFPPIARERAERLLRWLEGSAPEVVASWPEFAGEEPLSPSPLIAHLPIVTAEALNCWVSPDDAALVPGATEELSVDPAPPVASDLQFRGGASLIERHARCPARAFLEFRLGAREMCIPSAGIDASTRGSITHAVLQDFFREISDREHLVLLSDDRQARLLDEIIDNQLRRHLPLADAVINRIAAQEQRRLRRLLSSFLEQERTRSEFTVVSTEQALKPGHGPPAIERLRIALRPDRVDRLPDGSLLIVDYKTGAALPGARELWGPRPRSPQLPLYATLADADGIALVRLAPTGAHWLGVGAERSGIDGVLSAAKFTRNEVPSWGALRAQWWVDLNRLAEEFLAGDFRVDRWRPDEAQGQWAMAIRTYELLEAEEPSA